MHQFLPLRFDDFKSYYEFPARNRTKYSLVSFRMADFLRGLALRDGDYWERCYSLIKAQCDILESAQAFIDPSQAYVQPEPQVPDVVSQKPVPVGKTAPALSRKQKQELDAFVKRRKESAAIPLSFDDETELLLMRLAKGK